jgi:hypothetical protein
MLAIDCEESYPFRAQDPLWGALKQCEDEAVDDATVAVTAAPLLQNENDRVLSNAEIDILRRHLARLEKRKARTLNLVATLNERLRMERLHVSQCEQEIAV